MTRKTVKHTVWRGTPEDGHYGFDPGVGPRNDIVWPHPGTGYPMSVIATEEAIALYHRAWRLADTNFAAVRQLWLDNGIKQCVPNHWVGPPVEEMLDE